MESPAEYLDSSMDPDDIAYPCKGCGEILEEGKAFELAGNRWHLNCFRCNTCNTLLDSDANLLLLGDGSLICNNCTYSCSACGNKIEDLAILTGDQAFCATCFRCRNCKRKIENLRYARTSQGIFCMSCHESLMARRRKKSKQLAHAKSKEKESMLVDKSLPALPPNAIPQSTFSPAQSTPGSLDTDTPTELSPRPYPTYPRAESSRSSSRRAMSSERSTETSKNENLTLPQTSYRNQRESGISQSSDGAGAESEGFFVPFALDTSPAPSVTPRTNDAYMEGKGRGGTESRPIDRDYFNVPTAETRNTSRERPARSGYKDQEPSSQGSTPHIAFQEKDRQPSRDSADKLPNNRSMSAHATPPATGGDDDTKAQFPNTRQNANSSTKGVGGNFQLQEAPKSKKNSSRNASAASSPGQEQETPSGGSSGLSIIPPRRDLSGSKRVSPGTHLAPEKATAPLSVSQDSRHREDTEPRQSLDSAVSTQSQSTKAEPGLPKAIARKEIAPGAVKSSLQQGSIQDDSPSSASPYDAGSLPSNDRQVSSQSVSSSDTEEMIPPSRSLTRPPPPQQKLSDSYMTPREPPAPPPTLLHKARKESVTSLNGRPASPKLPRWSAGGDFTMEEDMARILGTDESSQSILRRVSNAVRHGRNGSEQSVVGSRHVHARSMSETTRTTTSPRWPKTPIAEDINAGDPAREISSPMFNASSSPVIADKGQLQQQLINSHKRISELERKFNSSTDLKNLNKRLLEKRKTVSVLDSQAEIMIRQIEVLAGFVESAKSSKDPVDIPRLEESSIKEFVQKLENLRVTMSDAIEKLYEERNELLEEKAVIIADRDRAAVEFDQLVNKNSQLADLNNDLTHQIQEKFKAQSGTTLDSPGPVNGLGIYTHHKDKSNASVLLDESLRPSTSTTAVGSVSTFSHNLEQDATTIQPAAVLAAPHVVDIRKGQAKKFNWKKGGQTVAKGVTKGFKGAFASVNQPQPASQWPGQTGGDIGTPYNTTVAAIEAPVPVGPGGQLPRSTSYQPSHQPTGNGFGLFKKSAGFNPPKAANNGGLPAQSLAAAAAAAAATAVQAPEHPSHLFGSDLVERADFERRQIPCVVTRCIQEVELRGMDIEGIYRKTGGSGQVKLIQEGFERRSTDFDFDISDPEMDITAVTSVLKQYFRKLPTPLLTFEVYDRVLESTSVEDDDDRCDHLRETFGMLPPKHRDCLEFLMFHLVRVAQREKENLMTPKNLAVVFAPTIMRDTSIEREMSDMHAKNIVVQYIIENSDRIFLQ